MEAPDPSAAPDGIYDIVVPPPEPAWGSMIGVLLLALGVFTIIIGLSLYLLRHRERGEKGASPGQRIARELDGIDRLREDLDSNRFALAISEALKNYLAERFQDPVRYETTPEFLRRVSLRESALPPAAVQELRDFLTTAEEVKFGRSAEAAEQSDPLMRSARQLVAICESVSAAGNPPR